MSKRKRTEKSVSRHSAISEAICCLLAARSRSRRRDRRISQSSGVSESRRCLLVRALSLDNRCCRASTRSIVRRFVLRWRFLVELTCAAWGSWNGINLRKIWTRVLRYVQRPSDYFKVTFKNWYYFWRILANSKKSLI